MLGVLPYLRACQHRRTTPLVLAQDADGPAGGVPGMQNGAFCLAASVRLVAEVAAVLRRREVRSKIVVPASLLNLSFATARELRAEGCIGRTVLPAVCFEKDNQWPLLLARRWRRALKIHLSEAWAAIIWFRILACVVMRWGLPDGGRVLDISDNLAAVCAFVRGRAHGFWLNRE